jgi:hypothetical protein
MIESLSALTLATHDMPCAVRFYAALGFDLIHGGEDAGFTSFRAGSGYLNLTAQPSNRRWEWWVGRSSTSPTLTRCTRGSLPPATTPTRRLAMPHGASATFTSLIRTDTSSALPVLCRNGSFYLGPAMWFRHCGGLCTNAVPTPDEPPTQNSMPIQERRPAAGERTRAV